MQTMTDGLNPYGGFVRPALAVILITSTFALYGHARDAKLPVANVIKPNDPNIRFIGHWDKSNLADEAVTVNSGSRIICGFTGHTVRGLFGTKGIKSPAEIYASIDGNAPLLYRIDDTSINFTSGSLRGKKHQLEIDVKDVDEHPNRWVPPLQSALVFQGLVLDRGARFCRCLRPATSRWSSTATRLRKAWRRSRRSIHRRDPMAPRTTLFSRRSPSGRSTTRSESAGRELSARAMATCRPLLSPSGGTTRDRAPIRRSSPKLSSSTRVRTISRILPSAFSRFTSRTSRRSAKPIRTPGFFA